MEYVDYYKVLGLDRGAKPHDISRAFKRLARKYHPDLNKSPDAEGRFKEVNEAHEVLKNPETRRRYDALGANWKRGASAAPAPPAGRARWAVRFDVGGPGGSAESFSDFLEAIRASRQYYNKT